MYWKIVMFVIGQDVIFYRTKYNFIPEKILIKTGQNDLNTGLFISIR